MKNEQEAVTIDIENKQIETTILALENFLDFFEKNDLDKKILPTKTPLDSYMSVTAILENFVNYLSEFKKPHQEFFNNYEPYLAEELTTLTLIKDFHSNLDELGIEAAFAKQYDAGFWRYQQGDNEVRADYGVKYSQIVKKFSQLILLESEIITALRYWINDIRSGSTVKDQLDPQYKNLLNFSSEELHSHLEENCKKGLAKNVAAILTDSRINLTQKNKVGQTPLHFVCDSAHEHVEVLFILLEKLGELANNEVTVTDSEGNTPLLLAINRDHLTCAGLLLQYSLQSQLNKIHKDYTPLHYVKSAEMAQLLIASGANLEAKTGSGLTPLFTAVINNLPAVVECLINNGANVNAETVDHFTSLWVACVYSNLPMVQLLLRNTELAKIIIFFEKTNIGYLTSEAISIQKYDDAIDLQNQLRNKIRIQKVINYLEQTKQKLTHIPVITKKITEEIEEIESWSKEKAAELRKLCDQVFPKIKDKLFDENYDLSTLTKWINTYKSDEMTVNLEDAIKAAKESKGLLTQIGEILEEIDPNYMQPHILFQSFKMP